MTGPLGRLLGRPAFERGYYKLDPVKAAGVIACALPIVGLLLAVARFLGGRR